MPDRPGTRRWWRPALGCAPVPDEDAARAAPPWCGEFFSTWWAHTLFERLAIVVGHDLVLLLPIRGSLDQPAQRTDDVGVLRAVTGGDPEELARLEALLVVAGSGVDPAPDQQP